MMRRLALLSLNLLLAGAALGGLSRSGDPGASPSQRAVTEPAGPPPEADFMLVRPDAPAMEGRSLFARPVVDEPTVAPNEAPPPEVRLTLRGVIGGAGADTALVSAGPDQPSERLHVGDEILGWRLQEVAGKTATFTRDARTLVLQLDGPGSGP